jgi:hypothetical protein
MRKLCQHVIHGNEDYNDRIRLTSSWDKHAG